MLINCVIGFCKNTETWIHPLYDMGYSVSLIEETLPLSKITGHVKPDVVVYSSKQNSAIAFDCKTGTTSNSSQLDRYRSLDKNDFRVYHRITNLDQFIHDVCFFDLEENHERLVPSIEGFPCITLYATFVSKSGKFAKWELNRLFERIQITDAMEEPHSYYPFSETDDRSVIVKEVLRTIISLLRDRKKRDLPIFARETWANPVVLRTVHQMYDVIGREHRGVLADKIWDIVKSFQVRYPDFAQKVREIQASEDDSQVMIANLMGECDEIIKAEEGTPSLDAHGFRA